MNKLVLTLVIIIIILLLTIGCSTTFLLSKKGETPEPEINIESPTNSLQSINPRVKNTTNKSVEKHENNPLLEIKNDEPITSDILSSDTRTIAVMIDNDNSDAWPHAGIEDAYLIYEAIVEGGSTRLMALFKDTETKKIGPVRSSRHYFLDYVMENDALYVHFGWSPKAAKNINSFGINNVNGVIGSDEWIFWREPKRKYDYHDAYTSIKNIYEIFNNKGYRLNSDTHNFNIFSSEVSLDMGSIAKKILIPYSKYHTTHYEYDKDSKTYLRWMRNTPHVSSTLNKQLFAKNIVIQFVKNYYLNDGNPKIGRQELDTVGKGLGFFIANGKYIDITWEKENRNSKTFYYTQEGNEININEGQTWIQIVPTYSKVTIE